MQRKKSTDHADLPSLPGDLPWKNDPVDWNVGPDSSLRITEGAQTDWFVEPSGSARDSTNAPAARLTPPGEHVLLSATVAVHFASTFDMGVLLPDEREELWTNRCFAYWSQNQPMIVSIVTHGCSDDGHSTVIDRNTVYLRVARMGGALGLHSWLDGTCWHMDRSFPLGHVETLRVGFEAPSSTGEGCTVVCSEIASRPDLLQEMRTVSFPIRQCATF